MEVTSALLEGHTRGSEGEGEKSADRVSAKAPHAGGVWGPVLGTIEPDTMDDLIP